MAPSLVELIEGIDAMAGQWYRVEVGTPSGSQWVPGDRWTADGGALVARQRAEITAAMGGGPDVAAMFAAAVYARAAVVPLVGAFRVGHVALDLTPGRLRAHRAVGGWFDRFALDPATPVIAPAGRVSVDEEREALGVAIAGALRATLTPYLTEVRAQVAIGRRGLWATVGDVVGETLVTMAGEPGGSARQVVDDTALILDHLAPEVRSRPSFRVVAPDAGPGPVSAQGSGRLELQRSVCCLVYKCENGIYCAGCPLTTRSSAVP